IPTGSTAKKGRRDKRWRRWGNTGAAGAVVIGPRPERDEPHRTDASGAARPRSRHGRGVSRRVLLLRLLRARRIRRTTRILGVGRRGSRDMRDAARPTHEEPSGEPHEHETRDDRDHVDARAPVVLLW